MTESMKAAERAEMIRLLAQELADDVIAREAVAEQNPGRYLFSGVHVPECQSKEAICRKITHLRQSLLALKEQVCADGQ